MPQPAPRPAQLAFDDLDTPLYDITFVVVDLETTGTSPDGDAITEIGAVKVRGGEVLGEFATLVDPGRAIPPQIVQITGITTAMVCTAPRIEAVLPGFLEFAAGAVLVAHNARFDIGFLKAAALACQTAWPAFQVLCTVQLARRILPRDEAPTVRLSALAELLGAQTRPTHRALDDARATVDVLHALIGRVGNLGVHSLTELVDYLPAVTRRQRAKRVLATDLPAVPGVYLFRGPSDEVLYIGTAVNLRRRVRSYFTGSETRPRMREMVTLATRVDHVPCAHGLEAGVRELRLLLAHTPPYNRRSKFPQRAWWLALTDEAFPRFAITRTPARDALGPFGSRAGGRRGRRPRRGALRPAHLHHSHPRARSPRRPTVRPRRSAAVRPARPEPPSAQPNTRPRRGPYASCSPDAATSRFARCASASNRAPPPRISRPPPACATARPPWCVRSAVLSAWPPWPGSPNSWPRGAPRAAAGNSR